MPLGTKGRLKMVRRVTNQEWSLTDAAEAAGVSKRTDLVKVKPSGKEGDWKCDGGQPTRSGEDQSLRQAGLAWLTST